MKKAQSEKVITLAFVCIFLLFLVLPLATMDWHGGKLSMVEKRNLASFPAIFTKDGRLSDTFGNDLMSWFKDNIGFRSELVALFARVKFKVLGISTSECVEKGKSGWYFYTLSQNIDIATGKFDISEETLASIAQKQQAISDYYKKLGINYALVLPPSKATVFPEYIFGGNYSISKTVCDIIEDYLKNYTDVVVINPKNALVTSKKLGKLYFKTDTHWTQLGSYIGYKYAIDVMNKSGFAKLQTFEAKIGVSSRTGDLSGILGYGNLLKNEVCPEILLDDQINKMNSGKRFDAISGVVKNEGLKQYCVLENLKITGGSILLYGDSFYEEALNTPYYFASNFRNVTYVQAGAIYMDIDRAADPDIVLFEVTERNIIEVLSRPLNIIEFSDSLPKVTEMPYQEESYGGMYLDEINGTAPNKCGEITISNTVEDYKLQGWAADFSSGRPLSALYVVIGDAIIKCNYGSTRNDVATAFENPDLSNTGFAVSIPNFLLKNNNINSIYFIEYGSDGSYCFKPVEFKLVDPGF